MDSPAPFKHQTLYDSLARHDATGAIRALQSWLPSARYADVVAFLNGERLVKRFFRRGGRIALIAENPAYPAIDLHDGAELVIWGVVVGKFKRIGA